MNKTGIRGTGSSKVVWKKRHNYPLDSNDNKYLNELTRLRKNLVAGKGNEDKHYEMQIRQEDVASFLYEQGVDTNHFYCPCDKYCN